MWGLWCVDTLLIPFKPSSSTAQPSARSYRAATQCLSYKVEWLVALSHWIRKDKSLTFDKQPATNHWQQIDFVYVFNLKELCPVFWWLCPVEKEGLCPEDHCGALRLWCPIQSVPQWSRGENPAVHKGPFLRKNSLNIPGGLWHLCKEGWSQTPLWRPRHIYRGSMWFDFAHWVWQFSSAWTFIMIPLHQC